MVAKLCGDRKIIVAAETREAAERALAQEMSLKRLHACTRALTDDPCGVVVPGPSAPLPQIGSPR
jgi:hypothetical protein